MPGTDLFDSELEIWAENVDAILEDGFVTEDGSFSIGLNEFSDVASSTWTKNTGLRGYIADPSAVSTDSSTSPTGARKLAEVNR